MVDVRTPLSLHRGLAGHQSMTVPGPFTQHILTDPHMHGNNRTHDVPRSGTIYNASREGSLSPMGASRNAPSIEANSWNTLQSRAGQSPLLGRVRPGGTVARAASERNQAVSAELSSYKYSDSSMGIARLVQQDRKPEQSREPVRPQPQSSSPSPRRPSHSSMEHKSHRRRSSTGTSIVHHLQIPATINDSKGSLADFAAQITCLFWFESSSVLKHLEDSKDAPYPTTPLVSEAVPSLGFRKWVTTILSTTQVTQNVILLALLFIYRLKKLNSSVKGKPGSEFRLLTVALMLGNKFLDDNTYTNKTWAEVSGISVQEIHIMEVEFLSNMRYSLYTSKEEWAEWQTQLGRFWDYFDRASRTPSCTSSWAPGSSAAIRRLPPTLSSPPGSQRTSPSNLGPYSSFPLSSYPYTNIILPHPPPALPLPNGSLLDFGRTDPSRKRSYDAGGSSEHPQKRLLRSSHKPGRSSSVTPSYVHGLPVPLPSLPTSTLSVSTGNPSGAISSTALPPLGGRAMSMVYSPQTPITWSATGNLMPTHSYGQEPMTAQNVGISGREPLRRQSLHPGESSNISPTPSLGANPQQSLSQAHSSPSYFLSHRNSPYCPVRGVSTLLVSPPRAAVQNVVQSLPLNQMHYHPLGSARTDYRTGVVPYMHHDPRSNLYQQQYWPSMPQPRF